jgi:hypothetical protein
VSLILSPDALPLAWEAVGDGGLMVIFEKAGPFAPDADPHVESVRLALSLWRGAAVIRLRGCAYQT